MIKVTKDEIEYSIENVEHMVHVKNLESILSSGLLSYNRVQELGLAKEDISMPEVQTRRHSKKVFVKGEQVTVQGKSIGIHDLVSFYFNTKNPMLYVRKSIMNEIVILVIDIDVIKHKYHLFSDGNAGSSSTSFYSSQDDLDKLDLALIRSGSWNDADESIKREKKRKMCSELLVYPVVEVDWIRKIVCYSDSTKNQVVDIIKRISPIGDKIEVVVNTGWFF